MSTINHEEFITDMIRYASAAESPQHIIRQLIEYIGKRLNSDRAYIFEDNLDGTFSNTYEWYRDGVSKQIDNLQNVPYEGMLDCWFIEYEKSHIIMIEDMEAYRSISEPLYKLLSAQGIKTLVTGPIEINGKYVGFYGVDNPPLETMHNIAHLIEMTEFVISMMIRLRNNTDALEKSATFDPLTHCKNRKALRWAYDGDYQKDCSITIMMCDLNGLKHVNDTKGHAAGDKYICDAAEALMACFGKDEVYRVGGDEFVVVLFQEEIEDWERRMERFRLYTELKEISISYGVSRRNNGKEPFENLLREADKRMYECKNAYYTSKAEDMR